MARIGTYKGKYDHFNTTRHFKKIIKLMKFDFYLYKWILNKKLRETVDKSFPPGRGTWDAVFISKQLKK